MIVELLLLFLIKHGGDSVCQLVLELEGQILLDVVLNEQVVVLVVFELQCECRHLLLTMLELFFNVFEVEVFE